MWIFLRAPNKSGPLLLAGGGAAVGLGISIAFVTRPTTQPGSVTEVLPTE